MEASVIDQNSKVLENRPRRDGYVDFFKGLLILWVIHIHTVFWSGKAYLPDKFRQASLIIDVAVFFFISGYLTKLNGFTESFKRNLKQFKVLYLNYLFISLLLLPLLIIAFVIRKDSAPDIMQAVISMLVMLKLENPNDLWSFLPVYRGSFWYIWAYLSLLFVLPFLIPHFRTFSARVMILASLLLLLLISRTFDLNFDFLLSESEYIYFYAFVFLLGTMYKLDGQELSIRNYRFSFLVNILICLILFFKLDRGILSIHSDKFPPFFEYLAYSLIPIHLFVIYHRQWAYPSFKAGYRTLSCLEWCGKNSYIIYLFQGIVCSVPFLFINSLVNRFSDLTTYFSVLTFNVFFTLLFSFAYIKLRSFVTKRINVSGVGGAS